MHLIHCPSPTRLEFKNTQFIGAMRKQMFINFVNKTASSQNVYTSFQMDINDPQQSVRTSLLGLGTGRGACVTPFDVSNQGLHGEKPVMFS